MYGRLAVGLGAAGYVAGSLGVPALALVAWSSDSTAPVIVGLLVVTLVTALAATARPRRLESVRLPLVSLRLLAVPVVATVAAVVGSLVTTVLSLGAGLVAAFLALLGLLVLRSGAATHHARRVTADEPALASLPPLSGRLPVARQRAIQGALGVGWLVLAVGALWEGGDAALLGVPTWGVYTALGVGFLLDAVTADRRLSVSGAGVLVETSLSARLFEWAEFAGYYAGDDVLVLLRREPWLEDLAFDRDAVGADAFAVLDESLPEREHRAVPAGDDRNRTNRDAPEH